MNSQINDVINLLEKFYLATINTKEDRYYLINLVDYISFINESSLLVKIVKDIEKQKNENYKSYYQLELKAKKELDASKKIIYNIIKKDNINDAKINELVRRIEAWGDDISTLNFDLDTLFNNIPEEYRRGLYNQSNNIDYKNYKFSKTLKLFHNEKQKIEDLKLTEFWHCWYRIKYIPAIFKLDNAEYNLSFDNLSEEEQQYFVETQMLRREVLKEISGGVNDKCLSDCKNSLIRLHNHFVSKLRDIELSEDVNKKEKIKVGAGKEVNIIEIGEYGKIYINRDYNNLIEPRDSSHDNKYWKKICDIAEGEDVIYDLGTKKYFNSNKTNPIYNTLGYEKTKILEKKGDYMKAIIEIKNITNKKINRSKGQRDKK